MSQFAVLDADEENQACAESLSTHHEAGEPNRGQGDSGGKMGPRPKAGLLIGRAHVCHTSRPPLAWVGRGPDVESLHLRGQPACEGESGRKSRPSSQATPSSLGAARGGKTLAQVWLPPPGLSHPCMGSNGVHCQVQPRPRSPTRAAPAKRGPGAQAPLQVWHDA